MESTKIQIKSLSIPENIFSGPKLYPPTLYIPLVFKQNKKSYIKFLKMSHLTLLPMEGEGSFLAQTIRLEARTLEPFHLEFPKFLASFLYSLKTLLLGNFR